MRKKGSPPDDRQTNVEAQWEVTAFYGFARFDDCAQWRERLRQEGQRLRLCGTVQLAKEGINGTVAAPTRREVEEFLRPILGDLRFKDLVRNDSLSLVRPFARFKVRLKREIISLRQPETDPLSSTGEHVQPAEWDAFVRDPEVVLLDTRNSYEVEFGTFEGAIDPRLESFGEFPDFVSEKLAGQEDKTVAMFCTGGIRCEKASSYMLSRGFKRVVQLRGGILSYLKEVKAEDSTFRGKCYVFDERESV